MPKKGSPHTLYPWNIFWNANGNSYGKQQLVLLLTECPLSCCYIFLAILFMRHSSYGHSSIYPHFSSSEHNLNTYLQGEFIGAATQLNLNSSQKSILYHEHFSFHFSLQLPACAEGYIKFVHLLFAPISIKNTVGCDITIPVFLSMDHRPWQKSKNFIIAWRTRYLCIPNIISLPLSESYYILLRFYFVRNMWFTHKRGKRSESQCSVE